MFHALTSVVEVYSIFDRNSISFFTFHGLKRRSTQFFLNFAIYFFCNLIPLNLCIKTIHFRCNLKTRFSLKCFVYTYSLATLTNVQSGATGALGAFAAWRAAAETGFRTGNAFCQTGPRPKGCSAREKARTSKNATKTNAQVWLWSLISDWSCLHIKIVVSYWNSFFWWVQSVSLGSLLFSNT